MLVTKLTKAEKAGDYYPVTQPNHLNLEEKDELLFALVELLELGVYRAKFDPKFVVLTKE